MYTKALHKRIVSLSLMFWVVVLLGGCQKSVPPPGQTGIVITDAEGKSIPISDTSRLVTVGTALTETVLALGAGSRLVGVDDASTNYLSEVSQIPKVGSFRTVSAEGILSLNPSLIIATADAGPPEAISQLKTAGAPLLILPVNYTVEGVKNQILTVARALNKVDKGNELTQAIDQDMASVQSLLAKPHPRLKVMFCGRGPNMPTATISGKGTGIDEMITLAGGDNPFTSFQGFRPMTDEAVIAAAPDVLLMTERSFERVGNLDGAVQLPGIPLTPAGKNRRVIPVSDRYFQGFGPGIGTAVRDLALKFYPELQSQPGKVVPKKS